MGAAPVGEAAVASRVFQATVAVPAGRRPAPRGVEVLPALAAPTERACSLTSKHWSGALQLGPGKPVYGHVSSAPVALSLGSDTRDGSAFVEAGKGSLELVGAIDRPEIFSKAPTTLASFVTPLAKTPLGWQPTGTVGRVGVTLDISDAFAVPNVVEKTMGCDKLTIDEPSYNAGFVASGAIGTGTIGGGVDLFLEPGRPPIARTKEGNYEEVLVLERRGRHTRVAIKAYRYFAVGWVASDAVGAETGVGMGGLSGIGIGSGSSRSRSCRHDLELIAEVSGTRQVVGSLRAGSSYTASTLDVADGFTAITVSPSWFREAPGAKLLVRTHALEGC